MTHTNKTSRGPRPVERVVVGDRGRVVLPATVRADLGLSPGSRLLLTAEPDGSLRLRPYRAVADAAQGLLADLGPGSMVDDLVTERRAAAAAEEAAAGPTEPAGQGHRGRAETADESDRGRAETVGE